jgi:hypothetical protein
MWVLSAVRERGFSNRIKADEQPAILVRAPRNSRVITCAIRIRLRDRACVCLLSSKLEERVTDLRSRCIRQANLLCYYPSHLLTFLFEERMEEYMRWLYELWDEVGRLESSTGMLPPTWKVSDASNHLNIISEDFGNLLQRLHAVNVELL